MQGRRLLILLSCCFRSSVSQRICSRKSWRIKPLFETISLTTVSNSENRDPFLRKMNGSGVNQDFHQGKTTKLRIQKSKQVPILSIRGGGQSDVTASHSHHEKLKGRLLLFTVAALYGTLNVAMRLVYKRPDPPSAAALSCCRSCVITLSFQLFQLRKKKNNSVSESDDRNSSVKKRRLWMVGLEFALWSCGSFGLLTTGLRMTESAIRASFFTQTSVIITPLLSILVDKQTIPNSVWAGCVMALAGLLTLTTKGDGLQGDSLFSFSVGDVLVLLGACCWSTFLLRSSTIGTRYEAVALQTTISRFRAVVNTIWLVTSALSARAPLDEQALLQEEGIVQTAAAMMDEQWGGWRHDVMAWCLVVYAATGPGALAAVLLQRASRFVSASEANVILCCDPIFTTVWSYLILGETISIQEGMGGFLILAAALLASGALDGFFGRLCGSKEKTE